VDSSNYRIVLETPDGPREILVNRDEFIWDAAARNGLDLPAICHHGRCLTCAGRLVGEGKFDQSASESYYPEDLAAGFVLLCSAQPRSDARIQTHQQDQMREHRRNLGLPAPYA
jgi:ferredoxin